VVAMTRVPERVRAACRGVPERERWLAALPSAVVAACERWDLRLGPTFDGPEVSAAWVAPGTRADGRAVVLKLGMPHHEGADEARGLLLWDGDPTVALLAYDAGSGAMLLERCAPGSPLRRRPMAEQDAVIGRALQRLHREPPLGHGLRPLATMLDAWSDATRRNEARWRDAGLVLAGLERCAELLATARASRLLATDLHAGNVLSAQREPWLVIDPKPFVGDPAYDATQHLLNGLERLQGNPFGTIARVADHAGLDPERVRGWTFVRLLVEPPGGWTDAGDALARTLA
jgi:streptomycin 6-kinase